MKQHLSSSTFETVRASDTPLKTFTLNISVSAIEKYQHESKQLLSIHHPHGDSKNFSVNALTHIIKTLEKFLQLPQLSRLPLILWRLQKIYLAKDLAGNKAAPISIKASLKLSFKAIAISKLNPLLATIEL